MDRSKVMVCPPRISGDKNWGQLSFPRQNDGNGMWSRLGLQGYRTSPSDTSALCAASVLCLKEASRCIAGNCYFFATLWFFHWEDEEGSPPVSPLQLLTVLSTPAPWVGHPAKAPAAAGVSKWKATHLLFSSMLLDGTFLPSFLILRAKKKLWFSLFFFLSSTTRLFSVTE